MKKSMKKNPKSEDEDEKNTALTNVSINQLSMLLWC